jgi:hypothetical protein
MTHHVSTMTHHVSTPYDWQRMCRSPAASVTMENVTLDAHVGHADRRPVTAAAGQSHDAAAAGKALTPVLVELYSAPS